MVNKEDIRVFRLEGVVTQLFQAIFKNIYIYTAINITVFLKKKKKKFSNSYIIGYQVWDNTDCMGSSWLYMSSLCSDRGLCDKRRIMNGNREIIISSGQGTDEFNI